jgi:NAD(P)-dependent dehydrogenase (short-subunit alcohol dehydrogenase family)
VEERVSDQGRVVATCRAPDSAAELQELRREHARRLTVLPLDVTDETTIEVMYKATSPALSPHNSAS